MDPSTRTALLLALCLALVPTERGAAEPRRFTFEYTAVVGRVPAGAGPIHVFVPLAATSDHQQVLDEEVVASIPGTIRTEDSYGNRYWHGSLAEAPEAPIEVRVRTTVERRSSRADAPGSSRALSAAERRELAPFLGPNARVVVDHPILEPIRAEVRERAQSDDPAVVSRAIYDWVVENVEYKKTGTGWGNGDTFWACTERYGNCTDFHALFISLARSEGIPARFEIGFPVPEDRSEGSVGGYHCWVELYLPGTGWFPVDASEAFKHPEKKEYFYGARPADRIHLTTGRDLELGEGHATAPLNYFVYPHVEVDGELWTGPVEKSFRYEAADDS